MSFSDDGTATFRVILNPLVSWIWAGGLVLLMGAIVTMWPEGRKEREGAFVRYTLGEKDSTLKV